VRIFFVRHGESEANILKVFSNRDWKHPLTEKGRQQARELAAKLRDRPIATIHTSPIQRAVETAQILGEQFNLPAKIEPGLIEYDVGIYEGRSDDAGWNEYARVEAEWKNGNLDARMKGGESCREIRARFSQFIERIVQEHRRDGAEVILVGHGGTFRQGLPQVLCNISLDYAIQNRMDNTACIEAELRDSRLRCVRWCGREV
jgi:probable phosphoglycerate mutase